MNKEFDKILERFDAKKQYFQKFYETDGKTEEDEYINKATQLAFDDAKNIVQEVAEEFGTDTNVGTNGWIACSVRLPEEEADVLLSLRSLDVYTGFRANAEGCFYIDGDGYVEYENVIAWMPLPEPYKESED